MPRTTGGIATHRRHKKLLDKARGFRGARNHIYSVARDNLRHALAYGFAGRKLKKRNYRALWIARINAAAKANEISYSRFINGLKKAQVTMDRRVLANIALNDPKGFASIVSMAKSKLA